MKRKNNGTLVGILIGLIIAVIAIGCLLVTGTINFKNQTSTNSQESGANNSDDQTNTTEENKEKENKNENLILDGTYKIESEEDEGYYLSTVDVTNSTDISFDFKISAAKGLDKNHVNIGEVKGTAKKTNETDYTFEENIEGQLSMIVFKFTKKEESQYLTIKEYYPNNINPYAGHGVNFAAEYKKELS